MKKFNVKVLSMAVTAAVASGTAGAAGEDLGNVFPKNYQGIAAFHTVFGEGTTYDKDTGKLTFKKDSDALLLKTMELEQTINGFASGSDFITTDANGNKTVRKATNEDIEADSLKGVGLAGGLTAVNARVNDVNARVDDVNARVDDLLDDTAAALDEQEKAIEKLNNATKTNIDQITKITEGVNTLNTSVAKMGEDISTKFDEVDSEISKASSELSESIEKVSEDVTAVNTRVDSLAQDAADAKAAAKAAEDKVTELSANVDSKVKEAKDAADKAKDAADKAVDAASKIDAVADKADKASKGVAGLTKALEKVAEQSVLAAAENAQALNGFKENDEIVVTDKNGIKSVKTATTEDVEQDEFGGLGLKEVAAKHDQSLADLTAETERAKKAAEQAALAAIENAQELNGFKDGDEIVETDDDGVKSTRKATQADVDADGFGGLGLKEVVAAHDEALGDLTETVNENSEALVKTAEVVNAISADVNANKAAIETNKTAIATKADKADVDKLVEYTADMGKKVNDIGDAVTELGDSTKEAIAAVEKDIDANKQDIVGLTKGLGLAAEAVEDNRKEIDANKAAIETNKTAIATKADKADVDKLVEYTADMGKKVNDIGDEVTALSDATSAAITRQDKDIVDLAKGLQLAAEAVEDNRKEMDANKAAIETKADKTDFEQLAKYTADMGKKVNDIGDEVTSLSDATTTAVARIDEDIVSLKKAGLTAADALEANRQDIDANKAAIAENTAKLEEQKEANEGFNNAITSLDEDIINLQKADLAAADALEARRTEIAANKAAIETKADKTAVERVETIAAKAQKTAQEVQGAVEVADSHAKAAQTAAAKAQESADTNAVQIVANTKQIDTNKADIATLQTASNQHAAGIAKNSARIDSLDKNVANLRKETRQGLAAQAALSGLFQPYSVGKFNVTAALGGFKSDTAVAVGAGYRFNENFAAKAGLAVGTSSGGSASYNVGLNYEW